MHYFLERMTKVCIRAVANFEMFQGGNAEKLMLAESAVFRLFPDSYRSIFMPVYQMIDLWQHAIYQHVGHEQPLSISAKNGHSCAEIVGLSTATSFTEF